MDSAYIPTASIPTAAVTSGMQTPSSIVFSTGPKDAVVDLLGIPSCKRSARIVSSEYFVAVNVAAVEDTVPAKFAYDTLQVFEQSEMFVVDSALYLNVVPPTVTSSIPSNSMLWDGQFFLYFLGISGLGFIPVWYSPFYCFHNLYEGDLACYRRYFAEINCRSKNCPNEWLTWLIYCAIKFYPNWVNSVSYKSQYGILLSTFVSE